MLHGDNEIAPRVIDQEDDTEELRLTPMKRTAKDLSLTSPQRKQRRIVDDEDEFLYGEEPVDGDLEEEDDEAALDEEDEESFSLPTGSRRKIKEKRKQVKSGGGKSSKEKRGGASKSA
jgi:hypothetical protein